MNVKHTPAPWKQADDNKNIIYSTVNEQGYVTAVAESSNGINEAEANAAIIVKAVNSHDALVGYVEHALGHFDAIAKEIGSTSASGLDAQNMADAARVLLSSLSLAKGE